MTTVEQPERRSGGRQRTLAELGPRYKWIALSNTTLGMLIATINSSIVLIALPDIFKGIGINPLQTSNTSYLLWMIMGFLVVTAVLVVAFGRLGDMFGRARMYNMGFAIFTLSSIFLAVTWFDGGAAALWLIIWRIVQGIGGAFLMANSSAIITDAFPADQRGMALGINGVAAIAGSFLGLVIGGVLAPVAWHLVFVVSVPIGVLGTIWAYLKLHDLGERKHARMDWWGNLTFAVGLIAVLVGITYGIQPYGGHSMGWTSPMVLGCIIGGVVVLIAFGVIETKVAEPLFNLRLFRIRSFLFGNVANLMAALSRGGLQFVLIIWLQGVWLPQHGYSFESTPLWAGIYMLPMTVGFLISAPSAGVLSDRLGSTRLFAAIGITITAVSFVFLIILPVNFSYWPFAAVLFVNGLGMGLFSAPNRAEVMNSLPGNARGVGAGMTATFQNAAMVLSIGVFFSLIITGLAAHLPSAMASGLTAHGVPAASAQHVAELPAVAVLFAAFLGYNPVQQLLGGVLHGLPAGQEHYLTGRSFFPHLISPPFADGLRIAFVFAIVACVIAAIGSLLCSSKAKKAGMALAGDAGATVPGLSTAGSNHQHGGYSSESVGAELAATAAESAEFAAVPINEPASGVHGTVRTQADAVPYGGVVLLTDATGRQIARGGVHGDGRYAIDGLEASDYVLTATAPGYLPQAVNVRIGTGEDSVAVEDFVMEGMSTLDGTVRTPAGPAVHATVVVIDDAGRVLGSTNTDEAGRFRIERLPGGTVTVTASAAEHVPQAVQVAEPENHHRHVDIELHSVTLLAGKLVAGDGNPVPRAVVSVLGPDGVSVATATTDDDGRYVLTGLAPGDYTLIGSTGPVGTRAVTVCAGEGTDGDIEFSPAHR